MRRNAWCLGIAVLLAAGTGCRQQAFLTVDDYKLYQEQALANLSVDPNSAVHPLHEATAPPMTVLDTNREVRFLSLAEAISIALEQGNWGNRTPLDIVGLQGTGGVGGLGGNTPAQFGGNLAANRSDSIRVIRFNPALAGLNLEQSLTKFDAVWQSSMTWQNTDRPVGTTLDTFQAQQGATNAIEQADATFSTAILKPLPTGGVAGITFNTTYTLTNLPARVNPAYRPTLQFNFEQPLLQGFGVEMNQIRPNHPGAIQLPGLQNLAPTNEGILISRIRYDQERAAFERQIHAMVGNVELAYWNLYYAYWQLFAVEALLRFRFESLRIIETRAAAGLRTATAEQVALARGLFEQSRGDRISALNTVLVAERDMRSLLQFRIDDGTRLVPSDQPTLAAYVPNWESGYGEAMTLRPELYQARQDIKAQQLLLAEQRNRLMPDLRFIAQYDINSIGNRLDGPDPENALRNLADNRFNNWQLGLRWTMPIGMRSAHADVRRGEILLARAYETLRDSELKIERNLGELYQRVISNYELIRTTRTARLAFAEQVRVRQKLFDAGRQEATIEFVLDAQRQWADALAREYRQIADYNQALVAWEYAKGTILVRNNVQVAEAALPNFAQVRAAEHEREKAAALKLREHPRAAVPLTDPAAIQSGYALPELGTPLPEVMKAMPLLKEVPPVTALPAAAAPAEAGGVKVEDLRQPARLPETLPAPGRVPAPPEGTAPEALPTPGLMRTDPAGQPIAQTGGRAVPGNR